MKRSAVGFVLGLLVFPVAVLAYFFSGRAPVATSEPPMPLEKRLARAALHARIAREMPSAAPIPADEPNLLAGGKIYREQCDFCHGLPEVPINPVAKGMFPRPPQLFSGKGVTDDPAGESYWKVANGIRLTGMPAYAGVLTTNQIWQVSLLVAHANELPTGVKAVLRK